MLRLSALFQCDAAGGVPFDGLARWDGTNWYALGSSLPGAEIGTANSFALVGNEVLVGGAFFRAGTNGCNNLASWRLVPLKLETLRTSGTVALSWPNTLSWETLLFPVQERVMRVALIW